MMNPYSLPFYPSSTLPPFHLRQPRFIFLPSTYYLHPFFYSFPSLLPPPTVVPSLTYLPVSTASSFANTVHDPCACASAPSPSAVLRFLQPGKPEVQRVSPSPKRRDAKRRDSNGGAYKKRWCLKKKSVTGNASSEHFNFATGGGDHGWRTSVMIKNIPNKYTKGMLLSLLDNHCSSENRNLSIVSAENGKPVYSEFDFFYLPMDFRTGYNLGYAFVNFTTPEAAWRLHAYLHKKPWGVLCSRKICEVTFARIQGLNALKKNFDKSMFPCNSDNVLPMEFFPARNGTNLDVKPRYIGRRV